MKYILLFFRTLSQRLRSPGDTTSTPPSSTAGGMVVGGGGMGTMYHHHVYPTLGGSSSGKTGSTSCGKNYGVGHHGGNGGTAGAGCSWRSLAVVFIVLTLAMAATSVFLVGKFFLVQVLFARLLWYITFWGRGIGLYFIIALVTKVL